MFGEALPEAGVRMLEQVVFERPRDLVVVIGTTGVFPYVQLPVVNAVENNVPTIEINPTPSVLSELVTHYFPERAAVALECLWPPPKGNCAE
jgi:NAD-dependent deacetylase